MLIGPEGNSGEIAFLKKYIGGSDVEIQKKPDFMKVSNGMQKGKQETAIAVTKPIVVSSNAMTVGVSSNALEAIHSGDNETEIWDSRACADRVLQLAAPRQICWRLFVQFFRKRRTQ